MKVLLLAGTGDARRIAAALKDERAIELVASLAGATRQPLDLGCATRTGGFGGSDGFRDYLISSGTGAVIDATHPFAVRMSRTASATCQTLVLPHIQMLRPPWQPGADDHWTFIDREEQAADHIEAGATVFLATGRQTLPGFANLAACHLICRQIDAPDAPFPYTNGRYLVGRPPFSAEDEEKLFRDLGVDVLVVKNSGGAASRTKLDAARRLGLRVILLNRPEQPACNRATDPEQVLDWVRALARP